MSFRPNTIRSTYSVVEYTPQAYIQTDLDLVFSTLGLPIPAGTGPSPIDFIDGATLQYQEEDFGVNGESNLDLTYAIALRKLRGKLASFDLKLTRDSLSSVGGALSSW